MQYCTNYDGYCCCPVCDYSLHGLPENTRCPECGFDTNPAEARAWYGTRDGARCRNPVNGAIYHLTSNAVIGIARRRLVVSIAVCVLPMLLVVGGDQLIVSTRWEGDYLGRRLQVGFTQKRPFSGAIPGEQAPPLRGAWPLSRTARFEWVGVASREFGFAIGVPMVALAGLTVAFVSFALARGPFGADRSYAAFAATAWIAAPTRWYATIALLAFAVAGAAELASPHTELDVQWFDACLAFALIANGTVYLLSIPVLTGVCVYRSCWRERGWPAVSRALMIAMAGVAVIGHLGYLMTIGRPLARE